MIGTLKRFLREEDGVAAVEYGLLTSLIALAIVGSITQVGVNLNQKFLFIARALGGPSGT